MPLTSAYPELGEDSILAHFGEELMMQGLHGFGGI
jgi:hypothetical protein